MIVERSPVEWALLPIQRFGQFSGRAPRAEYWWFYLATIIIGFIAGIIDRIIGSDIGILGLVVNLALLVPTLAVTVRRLHDTERTGWWILAPVGPLAALAITAGAGIFDGSLETSPSTGFWISLFLLIVAAIVLFIFMILPGTDGPNRYGEDPYKPHDHLEEIFG